MVFNYLTFIVDDNFLHTRPGSPPAFAPSPEASPRACIGCIGVISRFDELQLGDGSRGAVEEMQGENPGGRNGPSGIVNRIAVGKFLQKVVVKVCMNDHSSRFYWFGSQNPRSKALKLAGGFPGVQCVALIGGDQDQIEVTGRIDVIKITTLLRKKVGFAEIVAVSEAKKEGEREDTPGETKDAQPHMAVPAP